MKKFTLLLLIASLVISLAVPSGAVFASDEVVIEEPETAEVEPEVQSELQVIGEDPEAVEVEDSTMVKTSEKILPQEPPEPEVVPIAPLRTSDKQLVISYVQASTVYGKYVEIRNVSDRDYETKGLSLQFIRSSDTNAHNPDVLAEFYGTIRAGGTVVVANRAIPGGQTADAYFSQTANAVMSPNGGWLLLVDGTTELDSFCWAANGLCGEDYYASIPFVENAAYARCFEGERPAECQEYVWFEKVPRQLASAGAGFTPFYNACSFIEVSEVAPRLLDQFIELYNSDEQSRSLEGCILQINTRLYQFNEGEQIESGEYKVVRPNDIGVPLARTTAGEVRLLASDGEIVDRLKYSAPREDRSAMRDDNGDVVWTLRPTPGEHNEYVQYPPCEVGYWRNEETGRCNRIVEPVTLADCGEGRERNPASGRCRNIPTPRELAPCREGQYRSEETNRCRSIASAAARVLKPCADDQFRNPETNRCKKIASAEELADCGEGRERNPVTNRCRNILTTSASLPPFAPENITHMTQSMIGWWALGGVTLAALMYAGWQWRFEMGQLARRIGAFVKPGK